ncbi:MAG: FAD-dependent oxidoreductase [Erysipelotrichaceae bacterium]|jgi:thioredoxin reductase (NADPH)|nr:FAD-dependent oxidoreductase [Erysipelotrichaceae bacterium]
MFDIIIIGGGPAGMSAALYALRAGKSVLILEKENFGGQIANSPRLENYPAIKEISGLDWSNNLFEQISDLGVTFELEDVLSVEKNEDVFNVITNYGEHKAKVVIIANGVKHRHLGLENEERLIGHGIYYCAVCDGAFFKNQEVYLIGDANTALQYALLLSNYCAKVNLFTLFDRFFADEVLIKRLNSRKNIDVKHNMNLIDLEGDDELKKITFENKKNNEKESFNTNALFVAIGQVPDNEKFANLVELENNFILTDKNMETKTKGLYAIGDTRKKDVRQLVTACSDSAIAVLNALKYLD